MNWGLPFSLLPTPRPISSHKPCLHTPIDKSPHTELLLCSRFSRLFGCHLQEAFPDHPSKTGLSTVSSVLFPFLVAASLAYLLLSILPT